MKNRVILSGLIMQHGPHAIQVVEQATVVFKTCCNSGIAHFKTFVKHVKTAVEVRQVSIQFYIASTLRFAVSKTVISITTVIPIRLTELSDMSRKP